MTRKEAIARIKDHMIVHEMNEPRAVYISEALVLAIEALELQDKIEKEVYENKVKAMSFTFDKENRKGE